ncbi:hypothetical protein FA13DRAFT_1805057 [Coprinellus micaceus]|uniref:Uncharacterized protein n=1 Tax=Coprinellus micaceus TaxID=71717 RepID=A0A4Y7S201_COPMI|nr:hypothetical protein FA13DRAFT_1805057 [Coprinellus micaceus]
MSITSILQAALLSPFTLTRGQGHSGHTYGPRDRETQRMVAPSMLEAFRRTHIFRPPCCLCPFLDDSNNYAEAFIGLVEAAHHEPNELRGEYVAVCSRQRCEYLLRLEIFYQLPHLMFINCTKRSRPLPPRALTHWSDLQRSTGRSGLHQIINGSTIVGGGHERLATMDQDQPEKARLKFMQSLIDGVSEHEFWLTFIQCISCKVVMIRRDAFSVHKCKSPENTRGRLDRGTHHYRPYPSGTPSHPAPACLHSPRIVSGRLLTLIGDAPETRPMASIQGGLRDATEIQRSLTPTDIVSSSSDSETDDSV